MQVFCDVSQLAWLGVSLLTDKDSESVSTLRTIHTVCRLQRLVEGTLGCPSCHFSNAEFGSPIPALCGGCFPRGVVLKWHVFFPHSGWVRELSVQHHSGRVTVSQFGADFNRRNIEAIPQDATHSSAVRIKKPDSNAQRKTEMSF